VAPVATDPRPDIEKVIANYAGALESRDIDQVRHAYPGITAAQQASWQTFLTASAISKPPSASPT